MKKNEYLSARILIQIATGLYFTMNGLLGIMGYNSGANQFFNDVNKMFGKSNYLPLIISIVFLISGIGLLTGIFVSGKNRIINFAVFVLWIVYIIINYFTDNFMEPDLLPWLKNLSVELIILAGLWGSTQKS